MTIVAGVKIISELKKEIKRLDNRLDFLRDAFDRADNPYASTLIMIQISKASAERSSLVKFLEKWEK
jgi:hypothetical protein